MLNLKKQAVAALLGLLAMLGFVGPASAAVDASVTTALTAIQSDAVTLAGIVTPIVIAILGLGIGIKLIKRFANKV